VSVCECECECECECVSVSVTMCECVWALQSLLLLPVGRVTYYAFVCPVLCCTKHSAALRSHGSHDGESCGIDTFEFRWNAVCGVEWMLNDSVDVVGQASFFHLVCSLCV